MEIKKKYIRGSVRGVGFGGFRVDVNEKLKFL